MKIILVVDDQQVVRHGIVKLLGLLLKSVKVLEAENGFDAIEIVKSVHLDLVLLDVKMPKMNGMETLKIIKGLKPESKVIMLTQFDEAALVSYCLKLGANAFLLKGCDINEVETAVTKVLTEGNYFSAMVIDIVRRCISRSKGIANLDFTVTEFQILTMLKEGLVTKEIARNLGLTAYTVDSYRKELLRKTRAKNVAELVSLSHRTGIL